MVQQRSALIIGGGIVGVTSAYVLARDGWQVTVLDEREAPGMMTSLGNGRQLSYSHTNALASPGTLMQLPSLLSGQNDAFRVRLRMDCSFVGWMTRFLANCRPSAFRQNTLDALALAQESRAAMDHLLERHEIAFDRQKSGKIVVLQTEAERRSVEGITALKRGQGLRQSIVSYAEAVALEPALAGMPEPFAAALFAEGDETGDCSAFAQGLMKVVETQYNGTFRGSAKVHAIGGSGRERSVQLDSGETLSADLVVVAGGPQANALLGPLGLRQPIEPMKGYSFTAPIGNAPPLVSVTDNARRIVFTNLGDRMLVAGIAEMGRVDAEVDQARLVSMIEAARESLPEAADYSKADRGWAGLRPVTPNSLPIISMLDRGLAVNAGHGMLGWTLAMGSAERLGAIAREAAKPVSSRSA